MDRAEFDELTATREALQEKVDDLLNLTRGDEI
mgnify:CR=1 FL=1